MSLPSSVHLVRVDEQMQAVAEHGCACLELFAGIGEAKFEAIVLNGDVTKFGANLVTGPTAIGEGVHEPVFLAVEIAQASAEAGVDFFGGALLVRQCRVEAGTDVVDERGGQPQGLVALDHGILDGFDPQVRQITQALLTAPAHEIAVLLACPTGGLGEDQARRAALPVAAFTEQTAFEVMLVNAVALPLGAAKVADYLNVLEQFLVKMTVAQAEARRHARDGDTN